MKTSGIYQNGTVVLNETVDWPDGVRVEISPVNADADFCCDGSAWDDSPEAVRDWVEWEDSLEPVFTGKELERFESGLLEKRAEQKDLLAQWHERANEHFK